MLADGTRLPLRGKATRETTDHLAFDDWETPLIAVHPEAALPCNFGDIAFGWLDANGLVAVHRKVIEKGAAMDLRCYLGPTGDQPVPDQAYGFAAPNRDQWSGPEERGVIIRDVSSEVYMTLKATESSRNSFTFELARKHKGHRYYRGVSGAPIADVHGTIVALVVAGQPRKRLIKGGGFAKVCREIERRYGKLRTLPP